jgi:hypothetical protein
MAVEGPAEGSDLASLVGHFRAALDPSAAAPEANLPRRSMARIGERIASAMTIGSALAGLVSDQVVGHVFLKQIRDAADGVQPRFNKS